MWIKKIAAILLTTVLLLVMLPAALHTQTAFALSAGEAAAYEDTASYDDYTAAHADASPEVPSFSLNATDFTEATAQTQVRTEGGRTGLYIGDEGAVDWQFTVPVSGLYCIELSYFTVPDKGSNMERILYIDGKIPFTEAGTLSFSRVWKNAGPIEQDNRGNDKYVQQVEEYRWNNVFVHDSMGFYDEPFRFYLQAGSHTLRMETVKEAWVLGKIRFSAPPVTPTYAEALKSYQERGLKEIHTETLLTIQAEAADHKSSSMLSPAYDRSSPNLEPYGGSKLRLNILGGGRFSQSDMWVEYTLDNVPEDGLYRIAFKAKQSTSRGLKIARRLYVNGVIPYQEAGRIEFSYSRDYENKVMGDDKPLLIPLKKGKNVLRIESCLGELADFCREVTDSLLVLNKAYRKLVVVTGTNPDLYRDYMLDQKFPDVLETFGEQSEIIRDIARKLEDVAGENSSYTAILNTIALQLEKMHQKPSRIPKEISTFNSNLSALGTWINNIKQTDLDMDCFYIYASAAELPRAQATFFAKVKHEVSSFFASFFEDYNSIGNKTGQEKQIAVWINSGRDQAQIIKQMIDSDFTAATGIHVDMKLVEGALLRATVAGNAPDVALSVGQGDPINYAIRGAVADLTEFPGFEEVTERFPASTMVPLTLNGKCYGLPEKATFPMLFYREDILAELGVEVPQTWDDVYELLPVLQRNNMNFGLPTSNVSAGTTSGIYSFGALLYQTGGQFYNEDGSRAQFDSEEAIRAMNKWSNLYVSYGLPLQFDFVNRFSSGEMPLAITDYTSYNTLTVFAPQIRNMWGITSIPGTQQADGSVSHAVPVSVVPCMIMEASQSKDLAWKFLDWWTSAPIQAQFGHEIESLLGEAGRYPTANVQAMAQMSWPTKDLTSLREQLEQAFGIPEVPGGYYTWRHLDNAFRSIINDKRDPREVMVDYNKIINEEIRTKRQEFDLE